MANFGLEEAVAAASLSLSGIAAVGALSSPAAQAENARYQAAVARNNQTIAEENARQAVTIRLHRG